MDIPVCSLFLLSVLSFTDLLFVALVGFNDDSAPRVFSNDGNHTLFLVTLKGDIHLKPFCLNDELLGKNWRTAFLILRNCSLLYVLLHHFRAAIHIQLLGTWKVAFFLIAEGLKIEWLGFCERCYHSQPNTFGKMAMFFSQNKDQWKLQQEKLSISTHIIWHRGSG